jgi:hypothetical protein
MVRGVARNKMKCRHNLRRGVWGLKASSRSRAEPWWGCALQRKTILSVNRCTKYLNNKRHEIYSYFYHGNNTKIEVVNIFLLNMRTFD